MQNLSHKTVLHNEKMGLLSRSRIFKHVVVLDMDGFGVRCIAPKIVIFIIEFYEARRNIRLLF